MSMQTIDARGLSCPQPVLLVNKALQKDFEGELMVLLDNAVSRENVTRAARRLGYKVEEQVGQDGEYNLKILTV